MRQGANAEPGLVVFHIAGPFILVESVCNGDGCGCDKACGGEYACD